MIRAKKKSTYTTSFPAVKRVLENIGSIHNIQLSRLWSANKFLIVEGDDIEILKRLHNTLFPYSNEPLDTIPAMSIGGWGGWNYAIGSRMLLKNAGDQTIVTYCLFDSDYFPESVINQRYVDAEKNSIQLHIWSKKEIENYLLVPSAIHRIILREKRSGVSPTLIEVQDILDSLAEKMKDDVVDSFSTMLQQEIKGMQIGTVMKNARRIIKERWDDKLSVVSGKQLLSELSKKCRDEYLFSFSVNKIAKELQREEIHPELANVLQSIENKTDFPLR